jgi:hypothetical protein
MSIDPKILKRMQGEDHFANSQRTGSRRIKLERGQNAIVRYLPAKFGPDGLWFARIAKHWVNKQSIVCPRNTAEDFGGDPDCHCPVCELAEELNSSSDEAISKLGYESRGNAQYLTYCIMWEKNGVSQPMSEVLNPFEHWHYRNTFDELKGFYIAGGRRSEDSVLDYKTGNDFSVNRAAKGLRLDKLDSSPIFDLKDLKFDEYIKKLEAATKAPKVSIPNASQLDLFANKLQAAADRGGTDDSAGARRSRRGAAADEEAGFRRGSRQPAPEEDDVPMDDAPPQRPAAARRPAPEADEEPPVRRRAPAQEAEEAPRARRAAQPAETESEPEPAPRAARRTEPTAEPAPRRRAPEPEPEPEPEPAPRRAATRAKAEPEPELEAGEPEPEPQVDGASEPEPQEEEEVRPAPKRGVLPGRQQAARTEASRSAPQPEAEEEDPLPDDDKDPVPAAGEEPPPKVKSRGAEASKIQDRLSRLSKTE